MQQTTSVYSGTIIYIARKFRRILLEKQN